MFNDDQIRFLGNVIEQFQMYTDNSVNYVSFLHNYFEKVSSKDWPCKNEILELLSLHLSKLSETEQRAKRSLMNGGKPSDLGANSLLYLTFSLEGISI